MDIEFAEDETARPEPGGSKGTKEREREISMLLLRLSLEEKQGDTSCRSSALLDHSSSLLEAVIDKSCFSPVDVFNDIKKRAERKRYPLPMEAFIAFLMSPSTAGDQIARVAIGMIGILILSAENIPATLDQAIRSKVRASLYDHLSRCRNGNNRCSAMSVHVAHAFSCMVTTDWWPDTAKSPNLATQLFSCGPSQCASLNQCSPWLHRMCSPSHTYPGDTSRRLLLAAGLGAEMLSADLRDGAPASGDDELTTEQEEEDEEDDQSAPPEAEQHVQQHGATQPNPHLMHFPARLPIPLPGDLFTPRPHLRDAFLTLPEFPRTSTAITWRQATNLFSTYIIRNKDRFFIPGDIVHAHIRGSPLGRAFGNDVLHRKDAQQSLLRQLVPVSPASALAASVQTAPTEQSGSAMTVTVPNLPEAPRESTDEPMEEICCACHETLTRAQLCTLACNHTIHLNCASTWFQHSNTCPMCRDICSGNNPGLLPSEQSRRTMIFPSGATLTSDARTSTSLIPGLLATTMQAPRITLPGRSSPGGPPRRSNSFRGLFERRLRLLEREHQRDRCHPYRVPPQAAPAVTPVPAPSPTASATGLQDVHFLQSTIQVMMIMIAVVMASFLPTARAGLIEELTPPSHSDQSTVKTYQSNDILAFESFPRSVSMGMTSETVDLTTLADLEGTMQALTDHAATLQGSTQVPFSQAENFCSPTGYHQTLTNILQPGLKLPHFIQTQEFENRPAKTYEAVLRGAADLLFCNYSLSHHTILSLATTLDSSSSYYNQNRKQKFQINSKWLVDSKGETCKTGRTLRRGEIVKAHADQTLTIPTEMGSLYSCAEACKNLAELLVTHQNSGCMMGAACGEKHNKGCRFFSFNWQTSKCTLSSSRDVALDTEWSEGFNSLTAPVDCLALPQHQSTTINVNGTMMNMASICKFNPKGMPPNSYVYRSCPGVSSGLSSDILPLATQLDSYFLSLNGIKIDNNGTSQGMGKQERGQTSRGRRSTPAVMAYLKPLLKQFIGLGHMHLSSSVGMRFISGALPLTYLLLLGHSIISLTVAAALESTPTASSDHYVKLEESAPLIYDAWELIESPNLLSLQPTDSNCKMSDNILETANKIPSLLHALHRSLNQLQKPLHRLLYDPYPLTSKVREIITEAKGHFGFWTVYDKTSRKLMRFYTYKVTGDPETAVRQVAVIGGSSLSPVTQGTLVQGGTPPPGSPSWVCVAVVSESNATSSNFTPKECYGTPTLSSSEVYFTSFLPHADIVRVFGNHHLEFKCPRSSPGSFVSRGLLIFVLGRECSLSIDGAVSREADLQGVSAWNQPLLLVDKTSEFQPHKNAPFPPPMRYAVNQLANETLAPSIHKLFSSTTALDERSDLHAVALSLSLTFVLLIIFSLLFVLRTRLACYQQISDWCADMNFIGNNEDVDEDSAAVEMDTGYASVPQPEPTSTLNPKETSTISSGFTHTLQRK